MNVNKSLYEALEGTEERISQTAVAEARTALTEGSRP